MADFSRIITRPGVDPATVVGKPPPPPLAHEFIEREGLWVEKDAPVRLRDGVTIYVDIYRPDAETEGLGIILAYGPYGKHWVQGHMWPTADVDEAWISPLTGFEAPDPSYWCRHGYAVVLADPRGIWHSEGVFPHHGPQEREDLVDVIGWLGERPWGNGSVGMLGVSYLAATQYQAASMRPPALKAIVPCEAFSDWYREFGFHGGIPETGFRARSSTNLQHSLTATEASVANMEAHPLLDWYYEDKSGPLEDIEVPAYVIASWSDHGLHTRGTLEAYARMGSAVKHLEVHAEKKWRYFYKPESVERQRAFLDTYVLGIDRGIADWPKVRVQVRTGADESTWPVEELPEWPVPDVADTYHLDARDGSLRPTPPTESGSIRFDPLTGAAEFSMAFDTATTFIGPAALRLRLTAESATDADVFVVIRKFDARGDEVFYPFSALFRDGPLALGWLRASHRELDEARSTTLRPFHPHTSEAPLTPGEPVDLDIEIWPSGAQFLPGERLVLTIQGRDFVKRPPIDGVPPLQILHEDTRNAGDWEIHTGPEQGSMLLMPHHL